MSERRTILVQVSGPDGPGITAGLLGVLAAGDVEVYDMEQVVVRDRLTLDLLIGIGETRDIFKELLFLGWEKGVQIDFEALDTVTERFPSPRFAVTVVGQTLTPAALKGVADAIVAGGGNIDRIVRLSRYPVVSYELVIVGGQMDALKQELLLASSEHGVDIAVQPESLERRAKRLVVMDVDSTLIQDEVIDLLAERAGRLKQVGTITEAAMAGELDFEEALRARVRHLAGLRVEDMMEAIEQIRLTPGAATFVRTLRRLGYELAIVSGGFTHVTDELSRRLDIRRAYANELEVAGGVLTGRLVGPIVDRARKAEILAEVAASEGIPVEQTVAVGDGANDLDMLARAGLGIAFNAKPIVREAADTALSVPYLDAILFVLGIRREDVEQADRSDPTLIAEEPLEVPGTPPV